MSNAIALRCKECGKEYPLDPMNVCEWCFGPVEVVYDYSAVARTLNRESVEAGPLTMWRYKDLLPVNGNVVDLGTGLTPLLKADNLGRELGLDNLYIKNDCGNPSHSFKDRVVGVASTKAREFGFDTFRLRLHRQPRRKRCRPRRPGRPQGLCLHPRRLGARQGALRRRLRPDPRGGQGQLRRGQPPLQRARRQVPLGLRQHQHAPLLLRRLQDPRLRGRRTVGLALPRLGRRAQPPRAPSTPRFGRA